MRLYGQNCGAIVFLGLAFGLAGALSGCDGAGGEKTEVKPLESNILRKLGAAGQSQADDAKAKALAKHAKVGAARAKVFAGIK